MKALVVGYGSIGSRHARILVELGCEVSVVSSRSIQDWPCYDSLSVALDAVTPDYVIIATGTRDHHADLEDLAQMRYTGAVLVEKPLFHALLELPANAFERMYVAYNLRFHPVLQELRRQVMGDNILSAGICAGQYLPQWRPGADYRAGYSASRASGGGVLRDLSHELDYALWLLGPWRSVAALGGHLSHLEIDSDDVFSMLLTTEGCPVVSIQLDYLQRSLRREFLLTSHNHTYRADLARNVLEIDGRPTAFEVGRDDTYRLQHKAVLDGKTDMLCSASEGLEVIGLIDAVERASIGRHWVGR